MTDIDAADRLALSNLRRARAADPVADALGHRSTHGAAHAYPGTANVLALDLGSTTGWALRSSGVITSGAVDFRERARETRGDRLLLFAQWLASMQACELSLIAYEQVMFHWSGGGGGNSAGVLAAHAYGQFEGVVLMFAAKHAIPVRGVHTGTLKKALTGKGNAKKPDVIAAVQARGFETGGHDEADALGVLLWALGEP